MKGLSRFPIRPTLCSAWKKSREERKRKGREEGGRQKATLFLSSFVVVLCVWLHHATSQFFRLRQSYLGELVDSKPLVGQRCGGKDHRIVYRDSWWEKIKAKMQIDLIKYIFKKRFSTRSNEQEKKKIMVKLLFICELYTHRIICSTLLSRIPQCLYIL